MRFRWSGTPYRSYRNPHASNPRRGKHMTNAMQEESAVYTSAVRPRPKSTPSVGLAKDASIERNAKEREERKRAKRNLQRAGVKAAERVDAAGARPLMPASSKPEGKVHRVDPNFAS